MPTAEWLCAAGVRPSSNTGGLPPVTVKLPPSREDASSATIRYDTLTHSNVMPLR